MPNYYVKYIYHSQGMWKEDSREYGIVNANSEDEAKNKVARSVYPRDELYDGLYSSRDFFKSCLVARVIYAP